MRKVTKKKERGGKIAGGFNHDLSIPRKSPMSGEDINRHGGDPTKIKQYLKKKYGEPDRPGPSLPLAQGKKRKSRLA